MAENALRSIKIVSGETRMTWSHGQAPEAYRVQMMSTDESVRLPVALDEPAVVAMLGIAERLAAGTVATLRRNDPADVKLTYDGKTLSAWVVAGRDFVPGRTTGPLMLETRNRILHAAGLPTMPEPVNPFQWKPA